MTDVSISQGGFPSLKHRGMLLMLHLKQWDFNRASLIALGHVLTASVRFQKVADEIDGCESLTFSSLLQREQIRLKWERENSERGLNKQGEHA